MIDDITVDEEGTFTINYSHDDNSVWNKIFKWVKTIELNGTTGHFLVTYNHDTDSEGNETKYETDLRWVNNITVSDDGQITLKYTTGSDVILNKKLNFILETAIDDRYHLLVLYTDPDSIEGTKVSYNDKDNWIDLGYIGYGDVGAVAGRETDTGVAAVANILPPYSAWLIVEDGNDA